MAYTLYASNTDLNTLFEVNTEGAQSHGSLGPVNAPLGQTDSHWYLWTVRWNQAEDAPKKGIQRFQNPNGQWVRVYADADPVFTFGDWMQVEDYNLGLNLPFVKSINSFAGVVTMKLSGNLASHSDVVALVTSNS